MEAEVDQRKPRTTVAAHVRPDGVGLSQPNGLRGYSFGFQARKKPCTKPNLPRAQLPSSEADALTLAASVSCRDCGVGARAVVPAPLPTGGAWRRIDVATGTTVGGGVARGGVRDDGGAGLVQCGVCAAERLRRSLSHQDGEAQGDHGGEPDLHHIRVTNHRGDTARDVVMRNPLPDEVCKTPAGPVAELASVERSAASRLFIVVLRIYAARCLSVFGRIPYRH